MATDLICLHRASTGWCTKASRTKSSQSDSQPNCAPLSGVAVAWIDIRNICTTYSHLCNLNDINGPIPPIPHVYVGINDDDGDGDSGKGHGMLWSKSYCNGTKHSLYMHTWVCMHRLIFPHHLFKGCHWRGAFEDITDNSLWVSMEADVTPKAVIVCLHSLHTSDFMFASQA